MCQEFILFMSFGLRASPRNPRKRNLNVVSPLFSRQNGTQRKAIPTCTYSGWLQLSAMLHTLRMKQFCLSDQP